MATIDAIKATTLSTIVGDVNWANGPVPNVTKTPLVAGQWQKTGDAFELVVTNNARHRKSRWRRTEAAGLEAQVLSALLSVSGLKSPSAPLLSPTRRL